MNIYSYNVNGIRAALGKGLLEWIKSANPDVLCLQEIKAHEVDIPKKLFEDLGYHCFWYSAEKKGYSGVAILTKQKPDHVIVGCGNELYDREGRVLSVQFGDLRIVNTYFPSGTSGEERQAFKMEFLDFYLQYIENLLTENPKLVVVGDYNIAHTEIDIHDPKGNKKSSGFLPEERAWLDKWFACGMVDSFRLLHPTEKDIYSWWTYRMNARAKNKGWRIDYISVSDALAPSVQSADIDNSAFQSDHCPISVGLKVP